MVTEAVLDCSVALAWVLPDEASGRADQLFGQLTPRTSLWVPALWWYELANALTTAQRQARLAAAETRRVIELYRELPIRTDPELDADAAWRWHALAQELGLSAYDAAYIELAQRRGLSLATLDRALARAARRTGIGLVRV
jgi:predicted nucleic acid-binding protein